MAEVTGDRRGPGGHILTGPIYVEGAEPGDVLEVKVLSIDLPIDYGYNGCSGFMPANCDRSLPARLLTLDRQAMTAEFKPGIVVPAEAVLRQHGRGAGARARTRQQQPARPARRQSRQPRARRRQHALHSGVREGRAVRDRRRPRGAGRRRGRSDGDRDLAARPRPAHRAQGHEAALAARRNGHRLHQHGHRPGSQDRRRRWRSRK